MEDPMFPPLVYGTPVRPHTKPPSLAEALKVGYGAIDTAPHEETSLGTELSAILTRPDDHANTAPPTAPPAEPGVSRSSLLVQGKYSPAYFWRGTEPPPYDFSDPVPLQVLRSISSTLSRLRLDAVDVYLLHRPFPALGNTLAAWEAMEEVARRGGARALGVCQVDAVTLGVLWDGADVRPAVVQNGFFAVDGFDAAVRRLCRDRGIVYQAFGLFHEGNLEWARREREKGRLPRTVADEDGGSVETVAAWLLDTVLGAAHANGERFCVLDGSRNEQHMRANMAVAAKRAGDRSAIEAGTVEWPSDLRL